MRVELPAASGPAARPRPAEPNGARSATARMFRDQRGLADTTAN